MNFSSKILKLSILIMLVLVLLPVIAAEDSSEAFFVEYEDVSDEVFVVEEYEPVDLAQEQASLSHEIEIDYKEYNKDFPVHDQSGEIDNAVIIKEETKCPVAETDSIPDEINVDDENTVVYCENIINDNINQNINHNDVEEDVDRDVTVVNNSNIRHACVIFISEEVKDNEYTRLINDLFTETANYETYCFKRSLIKVSELKNDLLINQDVSFIFLNYFIADVDGDIIVCTDKITTDFVFSIDNSVIGHNNLIIFVSYSSFCSNFTPCFYAFVCCNLLDSESFFAGDNYEIFYNNSILISSYFNINMLYTGFSFSKAYLETY